MNKSLWQVKILNVARHSRKLNKQFWYIQINDEGDIDFCIPTLIDFVDNGPIFNNPSAMILDKN